MRTKILVGIDGSDHAKRAVEWCAAHAGGLNAEVVAAHVVEIPVYVGAYFWVTPPSPALRDELHDLAEREWCKPLADAGVPFRVVLTDGEPAAALIQAARSEDAALVVIGRRGLGGFKELLLGSTSHHLSHHLDRPLVIVP